MKQILLELPGKIHEDLWSHLMHDRAAAEEAAFVFVRHDSVDDTDIFRYMEWLPVPPTGFASRSAFHFELSDETRAAVIKRAHDLSVSLVELHSHTGSWPARFSPSDWMGFEEFVPHVWWRLKGRPYAAIVVSASGFDGLVWLAAPDAPARLDAIVVNGGRFESTRLSPLEREAYDE